MWMGLVLMACGEPEIDLADYDRSCAVVDDCVIVNTRLCGCGCEWGAVSQDVAEAYTADASDLAERCRRVCFAECDSSAVAPTCDGGTCGATFGDGG